MNVYLVGGAVRDELIGREIKEKDWVVVGSTEEDLLAKKFKKINSQFPVFLHPETKEEYALARKEKKVSPGHQGFKFIFDPSVTIEEDLKRRDFTMNAIAKKDNGELIDPYAGVADINNKLIKHVSEFFTEDPLRVFRCARFAATLKSFGFKVSDETINLMQTKFSKDEFLSLSAERVWIETQKALISDHPEEYFSVLNKADCLHYFFNLRDIKEVIDLIEHVKKKYVGDVERWAAVNSLSIDRKKTNELLKIPKKFSKLSDKIQECIRLFTQKNSDLEILDSLHKISFFRESSSARKAMELCGDLLKVRGSSLSLEPSLMLDIADKLEESKIEINHSLKDMKDEDKKSKLSELRLNIIRKTRTNL